MKRELILGHILRNFPNFKFSVDDFEGRLRIQKFIYLLQAHDIYLGYEFSWYIRGPYDIMVAANCLSLDEIYDNLPTNNGRFTNNIVQKRFKKFKHFINGHENDLQFLLVTSSIHYLLVTGKACSKREAIDIIYWEIKRDYMLQNITKKKIRKIVRYMKNNDNFCAIPKQIKEKSLKTITVLSKLGNGIELLPTYMEDRKIDNAVYIMLQDSHGAKIKLVGKNIFRPDEERPTPDNYIVGEMHR